jgi:phosphinothricin acetyltransferase
VLSVTPLLQRHWDAVRAIYAEGIATGDATFEEECPGWATWDAEHMDACRLVALLAETVVGWAALSAVSGRCVYGGVAEVSVYVAEGAQRRGVGFRLLGDLVALSEAAGLWTLQAGIFPENEASLALHERHGFRRVGVRERLGRRAGRWRDVVLMERRSVVVGS